MKHNSLILCVAALAIPGLIGCGVPGENGPADSFGLDFSMPPDVPVNGAIVFMVDGLNPDVFREMLEGGELPAIRKYLLDRGLYVPKAASNMPCITMSCLTSLVTGQFPAHHGLIAPKWFDRERLVFRNYETLADKNKLDAEYSSPNIYEQFPDRLTFSLFFQPHRGTSRWWENQLSAGPPFMFGYYDWVDRVALHRFGEAMDIARRKRQFPAIAFAYLLSPNFYAYDFGFSSPRYRQAIRHVDRLIGRVLGDIERAGLLDKLVIALVSDHGHADTPKHPAIDRYVRDDLGLKIMAGEANDDGTPLSLRQAKYDKVVGVTYGGGDRYWTVYLRRPIRQDGKIVGMAPWSEKPTPADLRAYPSSRGQPIDLPAKLIEPTSIEAVAYRGGQDSVRMLFKSGELEFRRQTVGGETQIAYKLITGRHPPEWEGRLPADVLAGKPLTGRQWLAATADTEFPDLPEQILCHFDGKLAGDIAVFPAPLWDIDGWRKAGHGGIRATEMLAPLLLAGPGVPHGRNGPARSVDLMPTLLQLLGKPVPPGLDGRPLFPAPAKPSP